MFNKLIDKSGKGGFICCIILVLIFAFSACGGGDDSESDASELPTQIDTPVAILGAGKITTETYVELTVMLSGAEIYYTLDGSTPTNKSTLYTAPFLIPKTPDTPAVPDVWSVDADIENFVSRTSAANNSWQSVCYGNGLFVAVADTGTGNRVMTSSDGINWTTRTSAADNGWQSVCYENGLFVAVADTGTGNRVMTSPDGINWTIRTSAADNVWVSVCYGNGLFVAVATAIVVGSSNVMTSPDGINWTIRTSAANSYWRSVCYGNGLFVAIASTGTGNRVMTSPDGINWTIRSSAADNSWQSVCYGNGLFVAVAQSGSGNRVMTAELIPAIPGHPAIPQSTILKAVAMKQDHLDSEVMTEEYYVLDPQ